ncbi:uncharacterized protein MEPE_02810 [Melanopsichium pennsylvanicum]|uniref:C2H2-type domain-containing protein n=1 Tax=Melanopsichium pennsylvanicum TaxID=63383 RepID=A0AAJ4XLL9_9BASI|nr:uncharacterized protein MEPE_02810 [Melanopsichium pennsylvanicum]
MDRNSCLYSSSGSVGGPVAEVPARSSSAPPNQSGGLITIEEAANITAVDVPSEYNVTYTQTSDWVESHFTHQGISLLPASEDSSLYQNFYVHNGQQSHVGSEASQYEMVHPFSNGGMPSLTIPYEMTLQSGWGPTSDPRFRTIGIPDLMHRYPWPAYSLSADEGQIGPARSAIAVSSVPAHVPSDHRNSETCVAHGSTRYDGQDPEHQSIAARVGALNLSPSPHIVPFAGHGGLGSFDDDASNKTAQGQERMQPHTTFEHGIDDMLRLPYLDEALRNGMGGGSAPPLETTLERNSIWSLRQHHTGPSFGSVRNESLDAVYQIHDSSTASCGPSSLASSRSLPELTWTSTDPWLSHSNAGGVQGDHEGGSPITREAQQCYDAFRESNHSGTSRDANADQHDGQKAVSRAIRDLSSEQRALGLGGNNVAESVGENRMEEGSIGSKRRIWYRAPNGQFASATQALNEQLDVSGSGNGWGSTRSNDVIRRIRRRRKSEEVERKYRCDFDGCDKAYGTLNHLNTHRATNEHGPRLNAVGYRRAHEEWKSRQGAGQGLTNGV